MKYKVYIPGTSQTAKNWDCRKIQRKEIQHCKYYLQC